MNSVVRCAVLGCGRMGRLHIERLLADGRGMVTALFDTNAAAVETLRRELAPAARGFPEMDELLREAEVDLAIVGTPTSLHFEHVRACRARGWHVLCEKPLADRREDLVTLIDDCRTGGSRLSVAYQRRTWPHYKLLRDEVLSGRWGAVRGVTSINAECWQQTIGGTWRDDPVVNLGGFIGDAGSHKIDAVFYVTGLRPREVFARHQNFGSRVEIVSSVSARLGNDVSLTMHFTGNARHFREDLHIHCEQADLLLRDWRLWVARDNSLELLPISNERWRVVMGQSPFGNAELDRLDNPVSSFLDQLLLGTPAIAPAECALPVFDFTQAALRSGRMDQTQAIDLEQES